MESKSLDELVAERKQSALQKDIFRKAVTIATAYGRSDGDRTIEDIDYTERVEEKRLRKWGLRRATILLTPRFHVHLRKYHHAGEGLMDVSVYSNGKLVFYQERRSGSLDSMTTYIPGAWENHLDELYPLASKRLETIAAENRRREAAALRANFGLQ